MFKGGILFPPTLESLSKKHVNFDQDLDFLIFRFEFRGQMGEQPTKKQEQTRHTIKIHLLHHYVFSYLGIGSITASGHRMRHGERVSQSSA